MDGSDGLSKKSPMDATAKSLVVYTLGMTASAEERTIHEAARLDEPFWLDLRIKEFSDNPEKINDLSQEMLSALHYAVRYGHIRCMKIILEAPEADVNVVGAQGAQPIHFAAKFFKYHNQKSTRRSETTDTFLEDECIGKENVFSVLLDHGANINATDVYGLTALRYAAQKGLVDALAILLKNPALEIEKEDTSGATALHSACMKGHVEAVKILIQHGANILSKDKKGMNCLHYAAVGTNSFKVLEQIFLAVQEDDQKWLNENSTSLTELVNICDSDGDTLLHFAVSADCYETCELLINKNADVNKKKIIGGKTPLHLAAANSKDVKIVQLLVENGADVQIKDEINETPLHKSARNDQVEIVQYLLKKGSKVDAEDNDWQTSLIEASAKDNSKILKILLDSGAKIDHIDRFRKSAVYWAAENNAVDTLQVLLDRLGKEDNMDLIEVPDTFNNSPLHIAAINGHVDVVHLLIKYGAEVDSRNDQERTPLHSVAVLGKVEVADALVKDKPCVINDRTGGENTAVHLAANHGNAKMLRYLIEAGADVDPKDAVGLTPLSHAAKLGYSECVKVLLEKKACTSNKDLRGRTPMFLASKKGHAGVMKELLEHGADVCVRDNDNLSMLDVAIRNNQKEAVELLLEHSEFFSMMRNNFIIDGKRTTPMREMIINLPEVAYKVLNRCMTNDIMHDGVVEFNYELIDDKFAEWNQASTEVYQKSKLSKRKRKKNSKATDALMLIDLEEQQQVVKEEVNKHLEQEHPLHVMCTQENGALLSHPLVSSLIRSKWERFGRPVFYSKFALFAIFLFFLTGYVVVLMPHLAYWLTVTNKATNETTYKCLIREVPPKTFKYFFFVTIAVWIIRVFSCLQLTLEVIQMINRRLSYVYDFVNWLECSLYILALLFAREHIIHDDCNYGNRVRAIGACTSLLGWIDLLLFTRKFPSIGIYIVMFGDVLKTFLKFSLTFSMFVMAFCLGFYAFFYKAAFVDIGRSYVKSIAMTIGEFSFDELFPDRENMVVPVVSWIIFLIFMIVMTILLGNMMVGLAVDDIKGVLAKAVITQIVMQVELVLDVEKTLPIQFQKRFFLKTKKIKTKNPKKRFWRSQGPTAAEIAEARKCIKLKQEKEKQD